MMPYRGLHYTKQYIKDKLVKFGYKLWMLCSSDGYPYNSEIYCSKKYSIVEKMKKEQTLYRNSYCRKNVEP